MFSQTASPVSIKSQNGKQLYYDTSTRTIVDTYEDGNVMIYEPAAGENSETKRYQNQNISFVTDPDKARITYNSVTGGKNLYTARYTKSSDTNVVVKYTLDNRIYIYGKVKGRPVDLTRIFRIF